MTEYTERVERERNKQAAEKWGKGVRYIHANNGVIETKYNNVKCILSTIYFQKSSI